MKHLSAEELTSQFKVSRASVRRRVWPNSQTDVGVDIVFVASGNGPRYVAVSVSPMAPEPGNGWKILSDDEVCDWLRQWGFTIDDGTEVPQPDQTVNGANPIPIFGGLPDLMALLAQASRRLS